MSQQQENDLLFEINQSNVYAFESLMMRYEERMFQFILKLVRSEALAEEITQDVFLKIWENRENLIHIDSIGAWMYTISRNKAINMLNEMAARSAREKNYALESEWFAEGDELFKENDLYLLVDRAVEQLPQKCRQIFILKRDEGLSNQEIADRYNLSIHTVKNQLKKSYAMLRKSIAEQAYLFILYLFFSK